MLSASMYKGGHLSEITRRIHQISNTSGFSGINTVSWIYELSRYEFPTPQVSYFKFFFDT